MDSGRSFRTKPLAAIIQETGFKGLIIFIPESFKIRALLKSFGFKRHTKTGGGFTPSLPHPQTR